MPDKFTSEEAERKYIQNILDSVTDHTIVIFTDDSAKDNPGKVESGTVIKKKNGWQSSSIKLAKAVFPHGSSYECEIRYYHQIRS